MAYPLTITRQPRKTCALYIRDGGVEVRAPMRMPRREIDRFLSVKEDWIARRLAESAVLAEQRAGFTLAYGDRIPYRGTLYPITAKPGRRTGFDGDSFWMPPAQSPEDIKASCVRIYRLLARRTLTEKALAFAEGMGVMPAGVKINGAKTRWGSCSARKSLNFSWRLMMAEEALIDYVVIHELAHLREMNHSPRFWKLVADVLPDYPARREGLKALQKKLSAEDWD
ncbi:MAG: M48 family metallopeptidase [Oscillospiraceae bacterium]|jgi:predicted metal-dependent hydrolase|nr:M48 family metallopeptidase [Oscillospiraceae bacterium]